MPQRGWRAVIGLDRSGGIRAQNRSILYHTSMPRPSLRASAFSEGNYKTVILMHAIDLLFIYLFLQFNIQSAGRKSRIAGRGYFAWVG